MSGKAYTMREMRLIVEYIVEHKAYGDVRGRKMWMDFANSQLTNRTWQSLKETFLKRILPDIHNPYYKLTLDQIRSFRQGYDVTTTDKNKLEIIPVDEDSVTTSDVQGDDNEQPETSNHNKGEKSLGENIKCSKVQSPRSSVETLVLDNCYETAEDIQKELESPNSNEAHRNDSKSPTKSLRDCITYSEPLTPMLQEVIDDFATDEECEDLDKEPEMQIVEEVVCETNNQEDNNDSSNKIPDSQNILNNEVLTKFQETSEEVLSENNEDSEKSVRNKSLQLKKSQETSKYNTNNVKQSETASHEKGILEKNGNTNSDVASACKDKNNEKLCAEENDTSEKNEKQNSSNGTNTDSVLPNNQEELEKSTNVGIQTQDLLSEAKNTSQLNNSEDHETNKSKGTKRTGSLEEANYTQHKTKVSESDVYIKDKHSNLEPNRVQNDSASNELPLNGNREPKGSEVEILEKRKLPKTTKHNKKIVNIKKNMDTSEEVELQNGKNNNENVSSQITNPCLKSVSLYDEQFSLNKYSHSESSDDKKDKAIDKNKGKTKKLKEGNLDLAFDNLNEVLELKLNSESEHNQPATKKRSPVRVSAERDRALANVFGFSSGAVTKRKRNLSYRRTSMSHHNTHNKITSETSDWTSESDSDFVSPPRGRRNRHTRKYLKPRPARILSLENEGLFVMLGKKIYPLVKDGKIIKNYLSYLPESDGEEEDSRWKVKYEEEKKKTEELTKLLNLAKESIQQKEGSAAERNIITANQQRQSNANVNGNELIVQECGVNKEEPKQEIAIKLKFGKKNEEVQLKGHWTQVQPVLEQLVHMFNKEPEGQASDMNSEAIEQKPDHNVELSSGKSTPADAMLVDEDVREKVAQIENEIFKEIEERDKEEGNKTEEQQHTNVTIRRKSGRATKGSPLLSDLVETPAKRLKTSDMQDTQTAVANRRITRLADHAKTKASDTSPKGKTNTPKKMINESQSETSKTTNVRQTRTKKSDVNEVNADEDTEVRYMLPSTSEPTGSHRKSARNSNKKGEVKVTQVRRRRNSEKSKLYSSSDDNSSRISIDSSKGYQDTDITFTTFNLKKRRKATSTTLLSRKKYQYKRNIRRRSCPHVDDPSSESSDSLFSLPLKTLTFQNSSLNTEVYRSDSYELLKPQMKGPFKLLEKINEINPVLKDTKQYLSPVPDSAKEKVNTNSSNENIYLGNSSNVSLPMSPELSIVENMSISKNALCTTDHPTINETQANKTTDGTVYDKYMMSEIDVSMPLMGQKCGIQVSYQKGLESELTIPECKSNQGSISHEVNDYTSIDQKTVSESLLNKICTVKIGETVSSPEGLDKRLRELLLESAKKRAKQAQTSDAREKGNSDVSEIKKKGSKKRCSTPRKKKSTQISKPPNVEPVVEEHMEFCSRRGRKSCPPQLQISRCVENNNNEESNLDNKTIDSIVADKPKSKRKKDVIKVKILKPRDKDKKENKSVGKLMRNSNNLLVHTDSRVSDAESGVFFQGYNDTVDLIHNHSETCLQATECINDSVEFVDTTRKSVISLNSSSTQFDDYESNDQLDIIDKKHVPDLFYVNAEDATNLIIEGQVVMKDNIESVNSSLYNTPLAANSSSNSLITEDLSDETDNRLESQASKWYLFSEDETSSTNFFYTCLQGSSTANVASFGSNLKQLFPITCAVPNLSTITEFSRDPDDSSSKPMLSIVTDVRNELFSP